MELQNNKKLDKAIRAVRKECLAAFEKAANKCLAIFPEAERNPADARLLLNILCSQSQESLDLFLRQFAISLDHSIGECWLKAAETEINHEIEKLEMEEIPCR